jgi:hypothetical protein
VPFSADSKNVNPFYKHSGFDYLLLLQSSKQEEEDNEEEGGGENDVPLDFFACLVSAQVEDDSFGYLHPLSEQVIKNTASLCLKYTRVINESIKTCPDELKKILQRSVQVRELVFSHFKHIFLLPLYIHIFCNSAHHRVKYPMITSLVLQSLHPKKSIAIYLVSSSTSSSGWC